MDDVPVVPGRVAYCGITGSAVALHCCKARSKSIGKMEKFDPL